METTRTTGHILPRHFFAAKCAVYLGFGRICEIRVFKMPKNLLGVRHFLGYRCRLSFHMVIACSRETSEIMVWAWMLWSWYALGTRTRLWSGHGCSGHLVLLEHERDHGLGMDDLVIVCSRNTNEIMLWSSYAFGTQTKVSFGRGCSGHRMLFNHE